MKLPLFSLCTAVLFVNVVSAVESETLNGLPSRNDVFAIAVSPHAKELKDYFTRDALRRALPQLVPADVQLPVGDKVFWQSGVIVLKDKTTLFWRTCGDWFIAIDRQEGTSFYALPNASAKSTGTDALSRRSFAFQRVALSKAQSQNLDAALRTMAFQRKGDFRCDSLEDAASLLWRSISIAIAAPRAAAEYGEFFVFSRLDWAKEDDSSFLSGLAVKKGTGEIYSWEENKLAAMPDLAKPTAADERQVVEIRDAAQEWYLNNRGLPAEESFRVAGFFQTARAIPGFAARDDRVWEIRVIHLNTTPTGVLWVNERTKKVASLGVEATNAMAYSGIGTAQLGDGLTNALPRYELALIAEQVEFDSASGVAFRVLVRNLGAKPIPAPDVFWGLSVVLDGKEYNREPLHLGVWNGRSEIIPKGVFTVGMSLSEFAIPEEALTAGRRTIALKDSVAESNALTVFIAPTSSDHSPENHEMDHPH